jgi:HEAT repeat protein
MAEDDDEARMAELATIAEAGDRSQRRRVILALSDPEELVRVEAIETLVALGAADDEALRKIRELATEDSELVRAYAAWALGRLSDAGSVALLEKCLATEESEVVKAGLLEGLFLLTRSERYLAMLLAQLDCDDGEARAFCSNSLVGVASADNVGRLIARLAEAATVEPYPAIRQTLEDNLATLRAMESENDFELG